MSELEPYAEFKENVEKIKDLLTPSTEEEEEKDTEFLKKFLIDCLDLPIDQDECEILIFSTQGLDLNINKHIKIKLNVYELTPITIVFISLDEEECLKVLLIGRKKAYTPDYEELNDDELEQLAKEMSKLQRKYYLNIKSDSSEMQYYSTHLLEEDLK